MEGNSGYSLEKYNAAKPAQEVLGKDDYAFVQEWEERLDGIIERVNASPNAKVKALLAELLQPDIYKLLMGMNKAEAIVQKGMAESKEGLYELAYEEATALNEEYDRRAAAVVTATQEFQDFARRLNERASAVRGADRGETIH